MRGSGIMRGMGVVGVLVGLLAWNGVADAGKPNPPGKQAGKFVVLGTGEVLDVRTSLRWQQEPGGANVTGAGASCNGGADCVWQEAVDYCAALGDGFRLSEIKELASLVDYSVFPPGPLLPPGHPFINVQSIAYWSITTRAGGASAAWIVNFSTGKVDLALKVGPSNNLAAWCVR